MLLAFYIMEIYLFALMYQESQDSYREILEKTILKMYGTISTKNFAKKIELNVMNVINASIGNIV